MNGKLLTFEGIDGAGKSTQINLLTEALNNKGYDFILFREPGGTKISEQIRSILLNNENQLLSPIAETLLFMSARAQLVNEKIIPELAKGKIVICDRFIDSTTAYQGYGRYMDIEHIEILNKFSTQHIIPNLTIFIDIDPKIAADRKGDLTSDRMEISGLEFFIRVRNGYNEIIQKFPKRFIKIDGNQSKEVVFKSIIKNIEKKILKEKLCD